MQLLPTDERFLHRALELAREAAAFASPNPTVGCVIVRDNEVLGEGAHFYEARDHAEIAALKHVAARGLSVAKATAYVTLEPCAQHGRTGPCAVALVAAGIKRCIIATVDPNAQVSGRGLQILRESGIKTDLLDSASTIANAARRLNDAFAFSIQHGRPFVTLKAAVSLDGYLAPPLFSRTPKQPHWLTGEAARADVQQMRHTSDAILTGVGTILADDPSLTDRTGLPRRRPLLRVVLDSQLRTSPNSTLLHNVQHDVLIVTTSSASEQAAHQLRSQGAEIVRVASTDGRIYLGAVMQVLGERNVRSLLIEAGSSINAAFLAANLVDKVVLYYSDVELGHGSVPFASFVVTPYILQQSLSHVTRVSFPHTPGATRDDVRIAGYLHDPWQGIA